MVEVPIDRGVQDGDRFRRAPQVDEALASTAQRLGLRGRAGRRSGAIVAEHLERGIELDQRLLAVEQREPRFADGRVRSGAMRPLVGLEGRRAGSIAGVQHGQFARKRANFLLSLIHISP